MQVYVFYERCDEKQQKNERNVRSSARSSARSHNYNFHDIIDRRWKMIE